MSVFNNYLKLHIHFIQTKAYKVIEKDIENVSKDNDNIVSGS